MIHFVNQNIFNIDVDAIVNPANVSLLAGSGLCGLIHKRAGKELEDACIKIGHINIGQAALTPAFGLANCKFVIHACGPRWLDGQRQEHELLAQVHKAIIETALNNGIKSIAIPAISTGIYRFPVSEAANIAVTTIMNEIKNNTLDVYFILNEELKFKVYSEAYNK